MTPRQGQRDKSRIVEQIIKKILKNKGAKMIIPIRCYSCGKPVGHLWEEFKKKVSQGEDRKKILDDMGMDRYCCRALFMGHVDLIDTVAKFKKF